jgi:hypothetical protein
MRRRGIVVVLVAAAVVAVAAGYAGNGRGRAPTSPPSAESRTTIYFLADNGSAPIGVRRSVRRSHGMYARGALEALLAGPTHAEAQHGITTAIPRGVRIISFVFKQGQRTSDVRVNLAGLPPAQTTNAVVKVRVITQITRTLVGHEDIGHVWIRGNGKPWGLWDLHGHIRDDRHDYDELLGFYHVCVSQPGSETAPAACFSALP